MKYNTSAIIPIRNEEENIHKIFEVLRPIYGKTEAIFVEGGSVDNSWDVAVKYKNKTNSHGVLFKLEKQRGKGKAGAVVTGFDAADGEYLIIVDADMSIVQKDLEKVMSLFFKYGDNILASGNRLRGIRKPEAFYWVNYIGNYFFRFYYSLLLRQKVLDVSCGTKAVNRSMWLKIKKMRRKYGDLDSWGDIDWLYYSKRSGASVKFVNISYRNRLLGESKLQNIFVRWSFAFQMVLAGFKIFKIELMNV